MKIRIGIQTRKRTKKKSNYLWKTISCHHNAHTYLDEIYIWFFSTPESTFRFCFNHFFPFLPITFAKIHHLIWSCVWSSGVVQSNRKKQIKFVIGIKIANVWITYPASRFGILMVFWYSNIDLIIWIKIFCFAHFIWLIHQCFCSIHYIILWSLVSIWQTNKMGKSLQFKFFLTLEFPQNG